MFASSHTASYITPALCHAGLRKVILTHFCLDFSRYFLTYFHFLRPSLLLATTKLLRERHKLLAALGMPEGAERNMWDTVQGIALDK